MRTFLAKGALLTTSLGFSFLLFEIILRSLGYVAIYKVYSNPEMLWQHDDLLGWSHEPNSMDEYIGPRPWPIEFRSHVAINSLGLRGPEPASLPPDGIRILILGDSMVAGFEVANEDTFVARLEKKLSEKLSNSVQVINGGVRGYGSDQSYLYFRERGLDLKPDVVLHFMSENDLIEDITIHRMRRIFGKAAFIDDGSSHLKLIAAPVPMYPQCSEYRVGLEQQIVRVDGIFGRMLCRLQVVLFDRSALFSFVTIAIPWEQWGTLLRDLYYVGMPNPNPTLGEEDGATELGPQLPVTDKILREMAMTVRSTGARFAFAVTPTRLRYYREYGILLDHADVLLLDRIEKADPLEVQFKHDSHYTVSGHEIIAEQMAERLSPMISALLVDRASPRH